MPQLIDTQYKASATAKFVQVKKNGAASAPRWKRTKAIVVPVFSFDLSPKLHAGICWVPVSYTHLTLPTIYSV